MELIPYLSVASALASLALAWFFFAQVRKADPGTPRMVELMQAIQTGARAFLGREYRWVASMVAGLAVVLIIVVPHGPWLVSMFIVGALFSGIAGYAGMAAATMANARTANAARTGPHAALPLAFRGGAIMGFSVAGLSLLGVSLAYLIFIDWLALDFGPQIIIAYSFGSGVVALTARIGGGIYTKAADVGADLVGKVEAGIPEDDPRNPATIADNVGDNVGDVAGMGADLFESHAGSIVAPIVIGGLLFSGSAIAEETLLFPLGIATLGLIAAIIGAFTVSVAPNASGKALSKALHRGTNVASALALVATFGLGYVLFADETDRWWALPLAVVAGLVLGLALGKVSEYYTSDHYKPVRDIAESAETGSATTILSGIATGKRSVLASVLLVALAIGGAYAAGQFAFPGLAQSGVYGVAIAGIGMLATLGVVIATDAYGPIADNAGGIAQMAELPPEVRDVTDELDSLGNTTAAIAKGFAIGSAALTALALFVSFQRAVEAARINDGVAAEEATLLLAISDVTVVVGLFIGAMLPLWFAARTITSVSVAANQMIEEVRRQFRDIPGLRDGKPGVQAEYAKCVDISTQAALQQMLLPGAVAVLVPIVVGLVSIEMLGGLLAGVLVSGFATAIYMANAGGAWDNAKKYIEAGNHGGKNSAPHEAAVVGDTVGDPFKDTSGPAMNTLIKLMTIVALIFTPTLVAFGLG